MEDTTSRIQKNYVTSAPGSATTMVLGFLWSKIVVWCLLYWGVVLEVPDGEDHTSCGR